MITRSMTRKLLGLVVLGTVGAGCVREAATVPASQGRSAASEPSAVTDTATVERADDAPGPVSPAETSKAPKQAAPSLASLHSSDPEPSGFKPSAAAAKASEGPRTTTEKLPRTEAEWKKRLTPLQFRVTRQHATEPAFRNEYWDHKKAGVYHCICCGAKLFASDHKYTSGTGWPSFWQPIDDKNLGTSSDDSWFSRRTEVHCKRCKAHLGHVFDDGPRPTGLRYCINSASLRFADGSEKPD